MARRSLIRGKVSSSAAGDPAAEEDVDPRDAAVAADEEATSHSPPLINPVAGLMDDVARERAVSLNVPPDPSVAMALHGPEPDPTPAAVERVPEPAPAAVVAAPRPQPRGGGTYRLVLGLALGSFLLIGAGGAALMMLGVIGVGVSATQADDEDAGQLANAAPDDEPVAAEPVVTAPEELDGQGPVEDSATDAVDGEPGDLPPAAPSPEARADAPDASEDVSEDGEAEAEPPVVEPPPAPTAEPPEEEAAEEGKKRGLFGKRKGRD